MDSLTHNVQLSICAKRAIPVLAVLIGMFLSCLPSSAQVSQGRILGSITDQSGGVVAGATVSVIDVARGVTRPLVSDSAGEFQAPGLTPGTYTVRVEAMGFKVVERQNVVVEVGRDVRVDLELQPGAQNQTVTVTEAIPVINTSNAELGGTVEEVQMAELPIAGRQYYHLLNFQPGMLAIPGGDSIGYASNGGRVSNSMWMFDGVDETEMWSGTGPVAGQRQASIMPIDAIEGVNVIQNPGAEYGWRVGAIVNMGVKSGTNSVHGSTYFFDRNAIFDAKNGFLTDSPKQEDTVKDFGVSVGGPIKKDKLFYFLSYEGEYFAVGNPYTQFEPTMQAGPGSGLSFPDAINELNAHNVALSPLSLALAGCTSAGTCDPTKGVFGSFPANGNKAFAFNDQGYSHNGVGKIDYHINDKHALNFEYYAGVGDEYSPGSIQNYWAEGSPQLSEVGRAVWIWTPNSRWVNQARFGNDINGGPVLPEECVRNLGQPDYASAFGYTPGTAGNPSSCAGKAFSPITIGNFDTLGNDTGGTTTFITHYSGMDTVSYTHGKHLIKFGGEMHFIHFKGFGKLNNLIGQTDFGNQAIPDITLGPGGPSGTALEDFLAGSPDSGALLIGSSPLHVRQNRYAGFIQDDWRVLPRLTINLGLRYEYQTPIKSRENRLGNFDPSTPSGLVQETSDHALYSTSHKGFGPRLGFVWDVNGKGTTVIRAGGSIIDDNIINFNDLLHTVFGAALQIIPTGWDLINADGSIVSPKPGNVDVGTVNLIGGAGGQLTWQQNTPIFNSASATLACGNNSNGAAPCTLNVINPHLRQSYVSTWTLAFEHAFTGNLALEVAYVGNHGTDLAGVIDVNQPALGIKGGTNELKRRPYNSQFAYFGQIRKYTPGLSSSYNGLQVSLNERVWRGLNFSAGYTYSHALDDVSSISSFNAFDNSSPGLNYGNSTTDIRHHFTFTGTYEIPGKKFPGQLLEGWRISSTLDVMSAFPFGAIDNTDDFSGTGEKTDRWNLVGPASAFKAGTPVPLPCFGVTGSKFATSGVCTVESSVASMPQLCQTVATNEPTNPTLPAGTKNATGIQALTNFGCYFAGNSAIVPPAQGTFGDMARNLLRASPFHEWDATVTKEIKIKERYSVEIRLDVYNVLNSVDFEIPSASSNINPASPSQFGVATGTISSSGTVTRSGAPRNMFIGAKFIF